MSYESRIEDIIYDVRDYVETNVNTYLTGITTNKGDGISLPNFKEFIVGDANPFAFTKYPVLMVNPSSVEDKIVSMGSNDITVELLWVMAIMNGKQADLVIQALRYAEGLRQCFLGDPTCGNAVGMMGDELKVEYYPSPGDQPEKKVTTLTAKFIKEVAR